MTTRAARPSGTERADCAHCGLAIRGRPVRGAVGGEPGSFCCIGCLLAMQVTRARGDAGAAQSLVVRLGVAIFFAMNVMMTSMPAYVPHVYGDDAGAVDGPLFALLRVLAAFFALPVLAILGGPIARGALAALRGGRASSDLLVLLAVLAAYGLSLGNTIAMRSDVYFDTAVMLLVLVTAGRWLEAEARAEAGRAIHAVLAPRPATARRIAGGSTEPVPIDALAPGDLVEVSPGEVFPTDGVVVRGEASCDESALTGESRPVLKTPDSPVAGGTCSVDGRLVVRVTEAAASSAAARIERLIDAARRERAPMERLADRVAALLVPLVLAIAAGAGAWWTVHAASAVHGGDPGDAGWMVAIAVLVVACPCALGIATPVAVASGLAHAARRGVVVRSAALLERAADAARVVFDKTGTLTEPLPRLVATHVLVPEAGGEAGLLARAAAVEHGLAHPLARAVTTAATARGIAPARAEEVRVVPGSGVRGRVEGEEVYVGAPPAADDGAVPALGDADGTTFAIVTSGGRLLGVLAFAERPRPSAQDAVRALRRLGIPVSVLSGDRAVAAIVPDLVAASEVEAGLLPEDKVARLRALRTALGARGGALVMVGDGINDAPALAAADLGVAVAGATDLARLTADVVLLRGDVADVPWLVAHARRVRRVARQNLAWAFGYNAVAVALAAAGALTPLVAALAMLGSSLAVVANARRLRAGATAPPPTAAPTSISPTAPDAYGPVLACERSLE